MKLREVHLLGHCVAGDEHRSAELLMFDNNMFSVGLQTLGLDLKSKWGCKNRMAKPEDLRGVKFFASL